MTISTRACELLAVAACCLLLSGCSSKSGGHPVDPMAQASPSDHELIKQYLAKAGIKESPTAVTDAGDNWLVMLDSPAIPRSGEDGELSDTLQPPRQVLVHKKTGNVTDALGGGPPR